MISDTKMHRALLDEQEQLQLFQALHYMKMAELKQSCSLLSIPDVGKKSELINRIMQYVQKGIILETPPIPAQSKSAHHPPQPLHPGALMLYGSYKNDAQTRAFFKTVVGPHFHFTAFGIDWLAHRWQEGDPPTYQEFARYWQEEYTRRKQDTPEPKKEWAYIRFLQRMQQENPHYPKGDLLSAWKKLQAAQAQQAYILLKKAIKQ
jgi:hypothetical protein